MDRFSTSLRRRNYNNRGLVVHNFTVDNCKINADGSLFVFFVRTYKEGHLLCSRDGGFTWNPVWNDATPPRTDIWYHTTPRAVAGLDVQGPIMQLEMVPDVDGAYVFTGGENGAGGFTNTFQYVNTTTMIAQTLVFTVIATDVARKGVLATSGYQHWIAIGYVRDSNSNFGVNRFSPYDGSLAGVVYENSFLYDNRFDMVANGESGRCNIAVVSSAGLKHIRYDFETHTFAAPTAISADTRITSIAIARDGFNSLCAVWGLISGPGAGTAVQIKYAISTDNGSTWHVTSIVAGGIDPYYDIISGDIDARVDVIGGSNGGFLFMYVRKVPSPPGSPRLWINEVKTNDNGVSYFHTLYREATSQPANKWVVGGHFFKPQEDSLVDLTIPGFVRIAYQVGEGTDELMTDSTPVAFAQELLLTAFPVSTPATITAYNQDFHALGMVGPQTTKYLAAFNSVGTTYMLRRYEPNADAEMGDRNSYDEPIETERKLMIDPSSYGFPSLELGTADYTEWIERDIRKAFLPPDFPPLRTFVLNAGNFLKRTVWTFLLDGNEYEISQVVPRFVSGQIVFYEVNAYVIGPSRDPWSRVVLPSET